MDLWQQIERKIKELELSVKELRKSGKEYAEAQRTYRTLLAQEILRLRAEGMPVTIIGDLARGNDKVADAKFNEVSTEAVYKANEEAINSVKLQIRVIESQKNQEWGVAKYDGIK